MNATNSSLSFTNKSSWHPIRGLRLLMSRSFLLKTPWPFARVADSQRLATTRWVNDVVSSCHYGVPRFLPVHPALRCLSKVRGQGWAGALGPRQERTDDHLNAISGFLGWKTVVVGGCQKIQNHLSYLLGYVYFRLELMQDGHALLRTAK